MECRQENGELCALVQSLRQEVADLKLAAARPHRRAEHVLRLRVHLHQLGGGESEDAGGDERAGADGGERDAGGGPGGGEWAV